MLKKIGKSLSAWVAGLFCCCVRNPEPPDLPLPVPKPWNSPPPSAVGSVPSGGTYDTPTPSTPTLEKSGNLVANGSIDDKNVAAVSLGNTAPPSVLPSNETSHVPDIQRRTSDEQIIRDGLPSDSRTPVEAEGDRSLQRVGERLPRKQTVAKREEIENGSLVAPTTVHRSQETEDNQPRQAHEERLLRKKISVVVIEDRSLAAHPTEHSLETDGNLPRYTIEERLPRKRMAAKGGKDMENGAPPSTCSHIIEERLPRKRAPVSFTLG